MRNKNDTFPLDAINKIKYVEPILDFSQEEKIFDIALKEGRIQDAIQIILDIVFHPTIL